MKSDFGSWLSDMAAENEEKLEKLVSILMALLKGKSFLSLPLKQLRKPNLLLRLPKRPPAETKRHPASDNKTFSLQNTDQKTLRDRTKLCCVWLNRNKNLTWIGSCTKKSELKKNKRWYLQKWRKILKREWRKRHWLNYNWVKTSQKPADTCERHCPNLVIMVKVLYHEIDWLSH